MLTFLKKNIFVQTAKVFLHFDEIKMKWFNSWKTLPISFFRYVQDTKYCRQAGYGGFAMDNKYYRSG